jgi:ABC-type branched-chain amino acid transport systems, ATPase component
MILLELDNVNLSFDGIKVIRELNFKICENQIVGIVGATESGKTTLFDIICGVYNPTSGKIIFEGQDITNMSIEKLNQLGIARTFQNGNVFQNLTVANNIRVGFYNSLSYNILDVLARRDTFFQQEKYLTERVDELLEIFELVDLKDQLARNIPYDLQCKLDIARAIATSPKLLLLDRPTNGMTNSQAEKFMNIIEMVNRKFKTAIAIIENDINLILNICNEISVMEYGTIIATGEPIEIKNNQALLSICFGE